MPGVDVQTNLRQNTLWVRPSDDLSHQVHHMPSPVIMALLLVQGSHQALSASMQCGDEGDCVPFMQFRLQRPTAKWTTPGAGSQSRSNIFMLRAVIALLTSSTC